MFAKQRGNRYLTHFTKLIEYTTLQKMVPGVLPLLNTQPNFIKFNFQNLFSVVGELIILDDCEDE